MQHQEHISLTPETAPCEERVSTSDPHAQQSTETPLSFPEEYRNPGGTDQWSEGEKVQPQARSERSVGGLLTLVVLLCAVFIAGSISGVILNWLSWLAVGALVVAGLGALASNWRVVMIPLPMRTFQIAEHARLIVLNGAGRVAIRRGEEGMIGVIAIKRASGFGIDPARMQIDFDQHGDRLQIFTHVSWNILQFGLRSIDFEITVPASCDIQLENGSGRISAQGTNGDIRLHTGSGSIEVSDLQGQIAIKTGSGGIRLGSLQGKMLVTTGSGGIEASSLQGKIAIKTGSGGIRLSNLQGEMQVATGSGGVKGDSLQGQLALTTSSGGIALRQSRLAGSSRISTGSGGILFEGTLDPYSKSDMKTGSGGITLRLPAHSAFVLNAHTGSGRVRNEFAGNESGDEPRAMLRLRTGSGSIHIADNGLW
jgi:hypothetical protein